MRATASPAPATGTSRSWGERWLPARWHGGTVIDIAPDELVVTAVAPNGSPAGSDGRVWRLPRRSARPSLPG